MVEETRRAGPSDARGGVICAMIGIYVAWDAHREEHAS